MKKNEVLQFVQDHDTFLITYYAKKHKKIITRKGNVDKTQHRYARHSFGIWSRQCFCILGFRRRHQMSNGNRWRKATNPLRAERIGLDVWKK